MSSKLEVLATTDRANKWHGGTVEEVKYENGKRLLKVRPLIDSRCAQQITFPWMCPANSIPVDVPRK